MKNNQCRVRKGRTECKDENGKWKSVGRENAKSNNKQMNFNKTFKKSRTNVC